MELALYCPKSGYYEQSHRRIGRQGDFFTSVQVGSLFGQLLACQIARWLPSLRADRWQLVEAGAHNGQLAMDILAWLDLNWPALSARIDYYLVEPSAVRRGWQQETLAGFGPRVRWIDSPEALPRESVSGLIFSNELVDSFPVQRLAWDADSRRWIELGVGLADERFVWRPVPDHGRDWSAELAA